MNRRHCLRSAGTMLASLVFPKPRCLLSQKASGDDWRTFEIKTRVEILRPSGTTCVWLPTALLSSTPFQETLANEFSVAGGTARIEKA